MRIESIENISESEHGLIGIGTVSYRYESSINYKYLKITLHDLDKILIFTGKEAFNKWNRIIDETPNEIIQFVKRLACESTSMPIQKLLLRTNKPEVVWARFMVMWYARVYFRYSWAQSGLLVNRDHATAMHAYKEITKGEKYLTPDQNLWLDTFMRKIKFNNLAVINHDSK